LTCSTAKTCCLLFKQGLHKGKTCVILIILFKSKNVAKKQCADVHARPFDKDTMAMLNAPSADALAGALKQQHPMGPIVWEQMQPEQDAYYCEKNIITTNIVGCASNSSPITHTTAGEATKENMRK
jgi:hypothetical protein